MIIFGVVLLIIGFITGIAIVWTIGTIVLVVGLFLWLLGALGHAVGGRRHYFLPALLAAGWIGWPRDTSCAVSALKTTRIS